MLEFYYGKKPVQSIYLGKQLIYNFGEDDGSAILYIKPTTELSADIIEILDSNNQVIEAIKDEQGYYLAEVLMGQTYHYNSKIPYFSNSDWVSWEYRLSGSLTISHLKTIDTPAPIAAYGTIVIDQSSPEDLNGEIFNCDYYIYDRSGAKVHFQAQGDNERCPAYATELHIYIEASGLLLSERTYQCVINDKPYAIGEGDNWLTIPISVNSNGVFTDIVFEIIIIPVPDQWYPYGVALRTDTLIRLEGQQGTMEVQLFKIASQLEYYLCYEYNKIAKGENTHDEQFVLIDASYGLEFGKPTWVSIINEIWLDNFRYSVSETFELNHIEYEVNIDGKTIGTLYCNS